MIQDMRGFCGQAFKVGDYSTSRASFPSSNYHHFPSNPKNLPSQINEHECVNLIFMPIARIRSPLSCQLCPKSKAYFDIYLRPKDH